MIISSLFLMSRRIIRITMLIKFLVMQIGFWQESVSAISRFKIRIASKNCRINRIDSNRYFDGALRLASRTNRGSEQNVASACTQVPIRVPPSAPRTVIRTVSAFAADFRKLYLKKSSAQNSLLDPKLSCATL